MKVKVSKVMEKFINQNVAHVCGCRCHLVKMSVQSYEYNVDYNAIRNEMDYDPKTGNMKALLIEYSPESYAMPKYITTRDLLKAFKSSNKTANGFINELTDMIAI